jgi:hypothetical protein
VTGLGKWPHGPTAHGSPVDIGDQEDAAWRRHVVDRQCPLGLGVIGFLVTGVALLDVGDQRRHQ